MTVQRFAISLDAELARVIDLTAAGAGAPFDPGMGRPSRGWLSVPPGRADWQRLAEEALGYVGTLPPK